MKQTLIWIIVLVFGIGIVYTRFSKPAEKLPDVSIYERRIDSLNNEIKANHNKVCQLDSMVKIQKSKIIKLESKLNQTAAQAAKEHKKYEENLKRLNAMSNSDIATLFAKIFK
jgi:septal ring factor EnvC (AmiA/AmiB activator)